jgi:hypothetical protein
MVPLLGDVVELQSAQVSDEVQQTLSVQYFEPQHTLRDTHEIFFLVKLIQSDLGAVVCDVRER